MLSLPVSVASIVDLLGPDVRRVSGPADRMISRLTRLSNPDASALTFCKKACAVTGAFGALICVEETEADATLIVVSNPRLSFIRAATALLHKPLPAEIHPSARIHPTARVDASVHIGPNVTVGENCAIGPGCVLHANVCLYPSSRLGARVVLHSGVAVGIDGFGFERDSLGKLHKFPHIGGVVIEDDVEIFSNCTIARGTLDDTRVGRGTKIDCLVHVGHNCQVGAHCLLTAQTMLAGGVTSGDGVWFSPGSRILNGLKIGPDATIGMGAIVMSDVPEGSTVIAPAARSPLGAKKH
jgi:UDP-3-O-[3-hydroxymyristoyl] glucosamine N-acyltransferase